MHANFVPGPVQSRLMETTSLAPSPTRLALGESTELLAAHATDAFLALVSAAPSRLQLYAAGSHCRLLDAPLPGHERKDEQRPAVRVVRLAERCDWLAWGDVAGGLWAVPLSAALASQAGVLPPPVLCTRLQSPPLALAWCERDAEQGAPWLLSGDARGEVRRWLPGAASAPSQHTPPPPPHVPQPTQQQEEDDPLLEADGTAIVQLDVRGGQLLVSTLSKCTVVALPSPPARAAAAPAQGGASLPSPPLAAPVVVGKGKRHGAYGGCFIAAPPSVCPTARIAASRPGWRLWLVSSDGAVLSTLKFAPPGSATAAAATPTASAVADASQMDTSSPATPATPASRASPADPDSTSPAVPAAPVATAAPSPAAPPAGSLAGFGRLAAVGSLPLIVSYGASSLALLYPENVALLSRVEVSPPVHSIVCLGVIPAAAAEVNGGGGSNGHGGGGGGGGGGAVEVVVVHGVPQHVSRVLLGGVPASLVPTPAASEGEGTYESTNSPLAQEAGGIGRASSAAGGVPPRRRSRVVRNIVGIDAPARPREAAGASAAAAPQSQANLSAEAAREPPKPSLPPMAPVPLPLPLSMQSQPPIADGSAAEPPSATQQGRDSARRLSWEEGVTMAISDSNRANAADPRPHAAAAPNREAAERCAGVPPRLEAMLSGEHPATGFVGLLLLGHAHRWRDADHSAAVSRYASRLSIQHWPLMMRLARALDRPKAALAARRRTRCVTLMLVRCMLSCLPPAVCLGVLRQRPELLEALPPRGYVELLEGVRRSNVAALAAGASYAAASPPAAEAGSSSRDLDASWLSPPVVSHRASR